MHVYDVWIVVRSREQSGGRARARCWVADLE